MKKKLTAVMLTVAMVLSLLVALPLPVSADTFLVNNKETLIQTLASAPPGAIIQLGGNITSVDSVISINKNVTLDLNGKSFYFSYSYSTNYIAVNGAALTVIDSLGGGYIDDENHATIVLTNGGSLTVNSGTVTGRDFGGVENTSSGTITVNGGSISGPQYGNIAIKTDSTATGAILITGGAVFSASTAISNNGACAVNITGGWVHGNGGGNLIQNESTGKITISGTAIVEHYGNNKTIYLNNGTAGNTVLDIQGGTVSNNYSYGNAIYNNASGKVTIASGATINGGIYPLTATPTASTTTVAKTTSTQANVSYTLSNSPAYADGIPWTVYTTATETTKATGVTAYNTGNILTLTQTGGLTAGDYFLEAYDRAEGLGISSPRLQLTATEPPPVPTTTVSDASLSDDTGSSDTDWITSTASQTISGTLSDNLAAGEKVEVSYDAGSTWSDADIDTEDPSVWSTATTLSGSGTFEARVTNADGSSTAYTHTYKLDTALPLASNIVRQNPAGAYTNATSVVYRVTFTEPVTGVDISDISLSVTGTVTAQLDSLSSVDPSTYDVTVDSITGDGSLHIGVKSSGTGIADIAGNPISGGFAAGPSYYIENTAPTVSITSGTTAGGDALVGAPEKAAGFNVVAMSSTSHSTLYVVPSDTAGNIDAITDAFIKSAVSGGANTDTVIAMGLNNTGVIDGTSYAVYAVDDVGNISAISGVAFTADLTAPTASVTAGTTAGGDALVNIAENANGFDVVAQSSDDTGMLYVVPSGTSNNIGTITGAAVGSAPSSGSNADTVIAITANNTGVTNGTVYKVYAVDTAGNISTISGTAFTADLMRPTATVTAGATAGGDALVSPAEKAAGFDVVAQSSEATGTLYVVPAGTSDNIDTITSAAIGSAACADADTDTTIAIPADSAGVTDGIDYKVYAMDNAGNVSVISGIAFTADLSAPNLTTGAVHRTSDTEGTVKFTSNEAGNYYYAIVSDGDGAPAIDTSGPGIACTTSETTITNPTGLAAGAKDIYIKIKDAVGNISNALKIDIAVYVPPSSDASLTSILGQTITAGMEAGTIAAPKTAGIGVANGVATLTASNIVKHDAGAAVTFYGTDSTFTTQNAGSVNLVADSITSIYIKVEAADGTALYYKVSINRAARHSSSTSTPPPPIPTPLPPAVNPQSQEAATNIIVNVVKETAATVATTQESNQTVTTVALDTGKIEALLETKGNNTTVMIPVNNGADVVVGQLNGQTVKSMENKEAILEIKTDNVTYTLPASQINIDNVSAKIGEQVELKDIKVNVTISASPQDTVKVIQDTANKNNYQVVVKPVEFNITCSSENKTVEVSKFNGYVERIVAIPDGVDPSKITTGIVLNADGTFSHVPTAITVIDGKYYAKINSLTNSTYSVIYSPKTVKSVENHWAKDAVNDMASRLVIVDPEKFEPDKAITRADFAEYIVRALGLYREGSAHENKFKDVSPTGDRTLAILIANEYGIVTGYKDGTFRPDDLITREEAMTMYQRAMKITKLVGTDENRYQSYTDYKQVGSWATIYVKDVLSAHVFNGTTATTISPKSTLTYAEAAQAIKNLLVESKLINK